ncbi:glycosyltransferase family 2 protein [Parapedobacter sp. DT-150]|uniref:glycosyltransferase family 2 protein n=1 Tax=Parapedobacter sp. DT-150 TaxID=3396162 RepID=UPI003F1BF254
MISIITVNYNQLALTVLFLRSLKQYVDAALTEVIVVDNGSTADQREAFAAVYPEVVYLRSEKNLGFAGGNNLGIRHAKGDYLLFLNNDTEITEGFVASMQREMECRPEIGLLSPLILYFDDPRKIQYAGYTPMDYLTGRNSGIGVMDDDHGQYDHITAETGYCHGAAMMCRRTDLDRVGLMEEGFFLYYEELDWCERFKRAGWKLGFTGSAKIYHKESMSVGKESPLKTYFMVRNRWLFIRRNAARSTAVLFGIYYLLVAMPYQSARYLIKGRFDLVKAAFRGIWWNVTHSAQAIQLLVDRG